MRLISVAVIALLASVAACGGDSSNPDAPTGDDTGDDTADDTADFDATPDFDAPPPPPDAGNPNCGADQLCFTYNAIDGVTDLPAGRLGVAWMPNDEGGGGGPQLAYDGEWTTATVALDLAEIAIADAGHVAASTECGKGVNLGVATVVIVTDTNASGTIDADELETGNIYGIFQEIVAYLNAPCPPIDPVAPDGLAMGVHVYSAAAPIVWLDGVPSEMQTCSPGSKACANLTGPL